MEQRRRNPRLDALEPLVGEWAGVASRDGQGMGSVRMTVEWGEGRAFLVQRTDGEPAESTPPEWVAASPLPTVTITGLDDTSEELYTLYADARGVCRVYRMSVADGGWRMWRDAPGFFQRYAGTFGPDGDTISGAWESSKDGTDWEHDFDLTYTRVRG
jgi:hypothetical protein